MRRRFTKRISFLYMFSDLASIVFSGLIAMIIRFRFDWSEVEPSWYKWYFIAFTFVAVINISILYFNGMYDLVYKSLTVEIPKVVRALFYSFAVFIIVTFFIRFVSFSRLTMSFFIVVALICQVIGKVVLHYIKKDLHKRGYGIKRVLFVGCNQKTDEIAEYLNAHVEYGFRVVGCLYNGKIKSKLVKKVGLIEEFEKVVKENGISTVIISLEERSHIEELVSFCELNYLQVYIIPDILDLTAAAVEAGEVNDIPMLMIKDTMLSPVQSKVKRIFDVLFSMFFLIFTFPVFIIVPILIKLTSPGPVFFKHKRLGHSHDTISVFKFRTMVTNASEVLEELFNKNPKIKEEYYRDYKLKNDPRVTRIGKFLRATSLDEIPQVFNVLSGEMSWVGPRPIVPDEMDKYGNFAKIILRVPPGITGYWQTNGRSDIDYDERIKLDIYYINNWSFLLDIMIILRTIPVMLFGKGAY